MAKLATFINQELPRILRMEIEFSNGKLLVIEEFQIERLDLLQWVGPEEPKIIGDMRFIFPAEELGLELEAIDAR